MNSEELELSLRTEFEIHLKDVLAEMRQEFSAFQEKVQAEFDKHKSQLDTVFQDFSARLESNKELAPGFKETVIEHLRLARDEGARLTATAFAEAEEMARQSAPPPVEMPSFTAPSAGVAELRDAIKDITAQTSQATILKSLVHHAGQYTPRGAFFIIKNEHFVGWRTFGKEENADDEAVREVFLPVSSSTVLGESVRSLSAAESSYGTYDDDGDFLGKLGFGQPDRMFAIPLVARGRGVAVLYADYGTQGEQVNLEALETLVRVAGLTVEVLASLHVVKPVQESHPANDYAEEVKAVETQEAENPETETQEVETQESDEPEVAAPEEYQFDERTESKESDAAIEEPAEPLTEAEYQSPVDSEDYAEQPVSVSEEYIDEDTEEAQEISVEPEEIESANESEETETYQPVVVEDNYSTPVQNDYQLENAPFESSNGKAEEYVPVAEPSEPVTAKPVKSRFSDRNVDLPIEVGEDERRLHNDARRFARLLVSEIKLYNEQKVKEGREAQDLYDRLREAIDRSRDMYDKRVQPPVAAKFDYFHYELVSTLAEGEENKLGGGYPGAVVK